MEAHSDEAAAVEVRAPRDGAARAPAIPRRVGAQGAGN